MFSCSSRYLEGATWGCKKSFLVAFTGVRVRVSGARACICQSCLNHLLDITLQWNMDMWGVQGVEAEAELLAAITTFFKRVGISSADVGIKVNSRAVLSEV